MIRERREVMEGMERRRERRYGKKKFIHELIRRVFIFKGVQYLKKRIVNDLKR